MGCCASKSNQKETEVSSTGAVATTGPAKEDKCITCCTTVVVPCVQFVWKRRNVIVEEVKDVVDEVDDIVEAIKEKDTEKILINVVETIDETIDVVEETGKLIEHIDNVEKVEEKKEVKADEEEGKKEGNKEGNKE